MVNPLKDIIIGTTLGLGFGLIWKNYKHSEFQRIDGFYKCPVMKKNKKNIRSVELKKAIDSYYWGISAMKLYVHYEEPATSWTKRLTVDADKTTLGAVLDQFAAAFELKFRRPWAPERRVMSELNQNSATRRVITAERYALPLRQLGFAASCADSRDASLTTNESNSAPCALEVVVVGTSSRATARVSPAVTKKSSPSESSDGRSETSANLVTPLELAAAQAKAHNFRAAREIYETLVLQVDSTHAEALLALAQIYIMIDRHDVAVNKYLKPCWNAHHDHPKDKTTARIAFTSGLKLAESQIKRRRLRAALKMLDELQHFLRQQSKCRGFFSDTQEREQMEAQMDILRAHALYDLKTPVEQETAISLLIHLLPDLQDPNVNLDALQLYARVAQERGKENDALSMLLRVLVGKSNDKSVKKQLVTLLRGKHGVERLLFAVPATTPSAAAAYAFVATILKDHSLRPALVTGVKHWHLRKESDFYPKQNFWAVIESLPPRSRVIFLIGEIDCREGILQAFEKCKYETLQEGMEHTIDIFMGVVREVVEKFGFDVFIHPIVPVLNETRPLVIQYNAILKSRVQSTSICRWLDFFDDLLEGTPAQLRTRYALDGTHLHPSYLALVERELNKHGKKTKAAPRAAGGRKGKASAGKRRGGDRSVSRDVYSDDDAEDEEKEARMNAKMDIDGVYEYEVPDKIDDDSEIDEEEAFNSDDEEQFGMFFQKQQQQKKTKHGKKDEDEEEQEQDTAEESEEDDEAGGDLLSDMLGTAPATRLSTSNGASDDEDDVLAPSDDEGVDAGKHGSLLALVDGLVPAKGKKKKLEEITDEAISASGHSVSSGGALTLSSLLGAAAEGDGEEDGSPAPQNLSKVKKQIRDLEADAEESGALAANVAPVQEARAMRKVAYEEKKEEMDLFQPVVRRNRKKETMDFREQIPKMENLTSASLASKFSAETSMEKSVEALLKAGGLSDDRAVAKEEHDELVQKKVSTEEVMQRQKELAKMRALMFYEEQKAKRVKKIKSKLYHKIRNNQNRKEQEKAREQLRQLDPELAKQLDAEIAEKRAEERMTFKHANTSKWVKHQLKRGIQADNETRSAIAEQLRRGEELRRKMQSMNSDDEDGMSDSGDDDEDANLDAATRLQRRLERQAGALVTEIDDDGAKAENAKGLAGMKFMQRAVQKQREKARQEAEKLLREIKGEDSLLSDDDLVDSDDEGRAKKPKHKKQKTEVTVTEKDKAAVAKALPQGALQTGSVSMDKGLSARASGAIAVDLGNGAAQSAVGVETATTTGATVQLGASATKSKSTVAVKESEPVTEAEENPWLSGIGTKSKKHKKKKNKGKAVAGEVDVGSAIDALTKSVEAKQSKSMDDGELNIAEAAATAVATLKKRKAEVAPSTANEAPKPEEPQAKKSKADPSALTQDELVRRAFAFADEDENEIAQEKEAIAAQDTNAKKGAEIAKLIGMNGWGSWAGVGVQKSYRQKVREETAKKLAEDTKRQVLEARIDSKMERVLINEKKDKRAAKFAVQEVPYPFTSREEYEMAMRNPLGSDWNTAASTNKLTAPKLIKRAGQMIDPLKLSKEDKKQAKKELSKKRKAKF
ncbi:hypothetical protein ATCC90586_005719 [Pythium insidiosum]|nr:hypothetical protein ATCC90586_005719 [Pythium insidiosum]